MANDTISITTPATPLSPLRMQNDRWEMRFLFKGHLQVVDFDLQVYTPA
jgi:hypothetical protein